MRIDVAIRDVSKASNFKITGTITDVPDGEGVETVLFVVKRRATDADADALLTKTITEESESGTGVLTNPSPLDGTAYTEVHVRAADWDPLTAGVLYHYYIKAISSGGTPAVIQDGTLILRNPNS